ncbi:hypothetical protein JIN84_07065 [Luteolibacter yonseiensis]|uniref:Uncharacterized protein n=1 Tax=Luteolibacter yonseiensis TaxID=1144680 RepID=A0A934R226_9BACT|nr:hypothetical protein [Luteolibacter yonseiensis]MBK1815367.1 hypothetical protein [Luteolibacter yonseiensis]
MKSDDFQRSVRSSKNGRSEGDAPNIGKVGRMPGTGLPRTIRRKRRGEGGGSASGEIRKTDRGREFRRKVILMWSLLLSGLVLVILGVSVWLWIRPNMERREVARRPAALAKEDEFIRPAIPSLPEADAIALVKEALTVREPERISEYFRLGESSPEAIVAFLKSLDQVDGVVSKVYSIGSIDGNGMAVDCLIVAFKGTELPRNRVAMLTPDEAGKWKVDFDAFARTVTPSWDEFLEKGAKSARVRIYAAADSYYNGVFRDETQWVCYGLASPDTSRILLGYCRQDSPQAAAMASIFRKNPSMNRATLEIRRVEGGDSRQVEISQVVAEDWVVGSKPFEDRFK